MHYLWLAKYYDELFSSLREPLNASRDSVLNRVMPHVKSACDLACGTGSTALSLASQHVRTYAVDLSPTMCRLAREKAAKSGLRVKVIEADMRSFRLPSAVDLITCEGDAINHVPRQSDLRRVARAVGRALRPGGHFYFDLNNACGFRRYWSGTGWFENPGVAVLMRNGHNPEASKAWSDIDWFIRDGSCWRRHSERVEEVCWNAEEIVRTFQENGFDRLQTWDAAPFWKGNPLVSRGCRTIYLARKAEH
jgi:SAM-dependent methyltransferase